MDYLLSLQDLPVAANVTDIVGVDPQLALSTLSFVFC